MIIDSKETVEKVAFENETPRFMTNTNESCSAKTYALLFADNLGFLPYGWKWHQGTLKNHNKAGKLHCEIGPAIQHKGGLAKGGDEYWYQNGKNHRADGPAAQRSCS